MRSTAKLALLGTLLLSGCWAALTGGHAPVTAARLEPGGKGLFVVRPQAEAPECVEALSSPNGATPVDCTSEYLVSCDASAPENRPFCTLMRERGPVRESIYPGDRR